MAQTSCSTTISNRQITSLSTGLWQFSFNYTISNSKSVKVTATGGGVSFTPSCVPDGSGTYLSAAFSAININNVVFSTTPYNSSSCGSSPCPLSTFQLQGNAPHPVNFKFFNAYRNKSNVSLTWETTYESNNRGFEIQRKTIGNDYSTVAFLETKAKGDKSESDLSYSFSDLNLYKGISLYRIRQVDFDGQFKYTEVRSVRGEEQSTTKNSVYPNPSNNGNVNVVFEDVKSIRDIQLMDMNGRVVSQWRNYSNNNIKIENLTSGFYSLRVVDQNTKEQSIEKIIVNRN